MCLPRFLEVAGWFKAVQRAVNAYAEKFPNVVKKIRVDARIGSTETQPAVNAILSKIRGTQVALSVEEISANAVAIADEISKAAGASTDISPDPKPKPEEVPTTVPPETVKAAQAEKKSRKWVWWVVGAVAVTGLGVGGYVWYRKSKGQPVFGGGPMDDSDEDEISPFKNVIDV